jgi:hypothetical protein
MWNHEKLSFFVGQRPVTCWSYFVTWTYPTLVHQESPSSCDLSSSSEGWSQVAVSSCTYLNYTRRCSFVIKIVHSMENWGIEPQTSCMLSTRSTNWANPPSKMSKLFKRQQNQFYRLTNYPLTHPSKRMYLLTATGRAPLRFATKPLVPSCQEVASSPLLVHHQLCQQNWVKEIASTVNRTRGLKIFSLALSQLSYRSKQNLITTLWLIFPFFTFFYRPIAFLVK